MKTVVEERVVLPHPALADADWADRYSVSIDEQGLTAGEAARRIMGSAPGWIRSLLSLRNRLGTLVGLRPAEFGGANPDAVGSFPIVSQTADRTVLGFDDRHLDFRIVVDCAPDADAAKVTVTTLVRRHNLAGRLYLWVISPFHRAIVRTMLRRVAPVG